jgi:hypothetical protein
MPYISKKAKKLLKYFQKEPSVKWRNEITHIVSSPPEESKVFYKKNGMTKKERKKLVKQSEIQTYLNTLKEYDPSGLISAII